MRSATSHHVRQHLNQSECVASLVKNLGRPSLNQLDLRTRQLIKPRLSSSLKIFSIDRYALQKFSALK